MADIQIPLPQAPFGATRRPDAWWIGPLLVFSVLASIVVYAPDKARPVRLGVGGGRDRLGETPLLRRPCGCASWLYRRPMLRAWMCLLRGAFSDVDVQHCALGVTWRTR